MRLGLAGAPLLRAVVLSVATLVGACSSDPYPFHGAGPGAHQYNPAALGEPIPAVVLELKVRPDDRIELLGAEGIGLGAGAQAEFLFSPPVISPDGTHTVGERLEALVGAIATAAEPTDGPGNSVGIVARITATKPGRYVLESVRLRYRLNGGPEQTRDGIDVVVTVCAADPRPADCNEESPPP